MAPLEFVCNVDGERALAITLGGGRAARDGELPRLTAAERNALATLLLREVPVTGRPSATKKAGPRAEGSANPPRGGWTCRREAGRCGRKPRMGRQRGRGRPRRKGAACKRRRDLRRSARATALASALQRAFARRKAARRLSGWLRRLWARRVGARASLAGVEISSEIVEISPEISPKRSPSKRRRVGRRQRSKVRHAGAGGRPSFFEEWQARQANGFATLAAVQAAGWAAQRAEAAARVAGLAGQWDAGGDCGRLAPGGEPRRGCRGS